MHLPELGGAIRNARTARGLTQAQLAREAGLSRETLNLLENGLVRDLGIRKVLAVLDHVGLTITVQPDVPRGPDYLRMACTTASVSLKDELTEDELVRALLTGEVPPWREAHLRALLAEAPEALLRGLAREAAAWGRPGKLARNLQKLAQALGVSRNTDEWLATR